MASEHPELAIFTALKEEYAAVERSLPSPHPRMVVLRGGVGPASAAAAATTLLAQQPRTIVSCGFCGGLAAAPKLGDVILAEKVIDGSGDGPDINCDPALLKSWQAALGSAGVAVHVGPLASVTAAVTTCDGKRNLGQRCSAIAVDMESYAIARQAGKAGVPVMVLRVISDTADDALPPEIGGFLDEKGNVRATQIAKFVLKGPRNIRTLMTLKARSDRAVATLQACWKALAALK